MDVFSLTGKTILITGASSGIGKGIAIECSRKGANVILTGRNLERLKETIELCQGDNNKCFIMDLNDDRQLQEIIGHIDSKIDGIIFCAGTTKTMPIKNIKIESLTEIFSINILSSIKLSNILLKKKLISHGGSIVFISSISTSSVKIGNSLYSSTKGAVNSFAKAMALEVAPQKIRVNVIQPGFVPSAILDKSGIPQEDALEWYAKRMPLGFGTPQDVAYLCIYLLSDASRWMTGSIITIDGGDTLQ